MDLERTGGRAGRVGGHLLRGCQRWVAAIRRGRCVCLRTLPGSARQPYAGRIPGRGHCRVRGAVPNSGRHWAMARTIKDVACCFVRSVGRTQTIRRSADCVARAEPDELRTNRIGFFEDDGLVPVHPETRAAVQAAAAALSDAAFAWSRSGHVLWSNCGNCGGSFL